VVFAIYAEPYDRNGRPAACTPALNQNASDLLPIEQQIVRPFEAQLRRRKSMRGIEDRVM